MSTIELIAEGIGDISNHVLFAESYFESQMAAVPGLASVKLKDRDRTLSFATGQRLALLIDGVPMWGGYAMQVQRGFALPADDTTQGVAHVKSRTWTLPATDYNILFDHRYLRDPDNYLDGTPPGFSFDITTPLGVIARTLLPLYLDLPDDLDWSNVDDCIPAPHAAYSTVSALQPQGSSWRTQMDDFSRWGILYYIYPMLVGGNVVPGLHMHTSETLVSSWGFSDRPNKVALPSTDPFPTYGPREIVTTLDATAMANDAMVWGGSEWAGAGTTVFARRQNTDSISAHKLWQLAEVHVGEEGYGVQETVDARADVIVSGNTTGTDDGLQRGLSNEQKLLSCAWFAHDVPKLGGVSQHLRPGMIVPMFLYTFGTDEAPLEINVPLRSMRISFPDLDAHGDPYVRFDGSFGIQLSDPHWLWATLLAMKNKATTPGGMAVTTDESGSSTYGSLGLFTPTPAPDGYVTVFTIPFGYLEGTTDVYLNGLLQRPGVDYTESDPAAGEITFSEALVATDTLFLECRTM